MQSHLSFIDTLRCPIDELEEDSTLDELYSVERLEVEAKKFAESLKVSDNNIKRKSLKSDTKKNKALLDSAYYSLVAAIQKKQSVSPASEWFVDNFHIIQDQLQEIKQNLTHKYYDGLPVICEGELKGYPRVYAIALDFIGHTDNYLDSEALERYLISFQKVSSLKMGEIWALIITLRVVLVQHLTIRALRLVFARNGREDADLLADQLFKFITRAEVGEKEVREFLSQEIQDFGRLRRAFIVRLIHRLRDQDSDISPASDWIEHNLNKFSMSSEQITQRELRVQAASQVSIGNIIGSMRLISSLDWKIFFERVNFIDSILAQESAGAYLKMDFQTRDRYRHAVEDIAKYSTLSEVEVAEKVISFDEHIGTYLIGDRAREFKRLCHYRPLWRERFLDTVLSYPTFFYLGSLLFATLLIVSPVLYYFFVSGGSAGLGVAFGAIALLLATELAQSFINLYVNYFIKPKNLPRMDMKDDIGEESTTMVVIPTLLTSIDSVNTLVEKIEIHALANRGKNIFFALLSDFADSTQENMPSDSSILDLATKKIELLNRRYSVNSVDLFYLFHRRRVWNTRENCWMGWERKRGKILEFNRLLKGDKNTTYVRVTASEEICSKVKYIITLDSDTNLPRGAAKKLIATITHPLNRPSIDPKSKRVTSGYGILQPRISVTSSSALETLFSKISSGNVGIDPYSTAVSDVYQDLFLEGSYTGKGLYVLDAFEEALQGRAPDNMILSHDLFEGAFARCALVSDVELFDDYPMGYDSFAKRCHRWIRGDWQIALWIFPWVLNNKREWVKNDLSLISRWKIFDNLRRSLVPIAALLWLILAWIILPGSPYIWTFAAIFIYLFPVYAPFATGQWMQRGNTTWQGHVLSGLLETKIKCSQIFITLAFLANQAWTHIDAICRSLYRLIISKKSLLEWSPFSQAKEESKGYFYYKDILDQGVVLAILIGMAILFIRPASLLIYLPFFFLWSSNPLLKRYLLKSPVRKLAKLSKEEQREFRFYARSTWHFFEKFVTEKSNWLAPDNFQEDPTPVIAYRTSPTNIGLQLLSYISAYDFGYLGKYELIEQYEKVFRTLKELPKCRGHFLNWYDIEELEPLSPRYISTVDSGNLVGHLFVLRQFLSEFENSKRSYTQLCNGLEDTVFVLAEKIYKLDFSNVDKKDDELLKILHDMTNQVQNLNVVGEGEWSDALTVLFQGASTIKKNLGELPESESVYKSLSWAKRLLNQIKEFQRDISKDGRDLNVPRHELLHDCDRIIEEMDFRFLFNDKRKLFSIGFKVEDNEFDSSFYDLLASESRLTSFVAIAKGDVPLEHWFRLGRQMASVKGVHALISWSASMFEYLMPILIMKRYDETLLDQSYDSIVRRQIEYGREKSVPWGVSESGYNARDLQMNYQYGPFGVPGLGLKRGLSNELVISPYSTMLAAMIAPKEALKNLRKMRGLGALSDYGFYESIDYTVERLPDKNNFAIIHSYMAHHQGMSLISLNNLIHKSIMQERFHRETVVMATELLLQERMPNNLEYSLLREEEVEHSGFLHSAKNFYPREYYDVNLSLPRTQILSNGNYSVLMTSAGSGFSRCNDVSVSRWREDATRDNWGQYYYIQNLKTSDYWSTTYRPVGEDSNRFGSVFSADRVKFWRNDKNILTKTEIIISPEDNVELRKITLVNETDETQELKVTSFMEVALARIEHDSAHPAFSKLFVQTEVGPNKKSLLASRRRRSNHEKMFWAFHSICADTSFQYPVEFETDRSAFIGRGRTSRNPVTIEKDESLTNTVGAVLDPVFSLRKKVNLAAGETIQIIFSTGMVESKAEALELIEKYSDYHTFQRESEMAWTQAQIQLRHLKINNLKAHVYQKLAGRVLYLDASLRPSSEILSQNTRTQVGLWPYGISGDTPIVFVEINNEKDVSLIKDLLHAHEYMRLKGLKIDLVVLNQNSSSYLQSLQDELQRQVRISGCQGLLNKHGGVFLLRCDLMPKEDIILLRSVARVIFKGELGYLEEQLKRRKARVEMPSRLIAEKEVPMYRSSQNLRPELDFFNGIGGFSTDSREYIIALENNSWTPTPWINVIANSLDFGFTISDSGACHTWSLNSRENRITPWSNDPVCDPSGEIIYIRDEQTGEYWTPTPLPIREEAPYLIRHGQGYSTFEHSSHDIEQTLEMFVPIDAEVKISKLKLKNLSTSDRLLSVTHYVEWVLGVHRETSAAHVITEYDSSLNTVFARSPYNNEFAARVSFSSVVCFSDVQAQSFTCDRREFLGRNGDMEDPAALKRVGLSNTFGAGLDPCAASFSKFRLEENEEKTIIILLGQCENKGRARELVEKYRKLEAVKESYEKVLDYWDKLLNRVQIKTPDESMNRLVNDWLPYQVLSCRIWARTAFYQSGGAYGFRDQLQDAMAMVYFKPEITRSQILRHAARQFKEGDVQHWWHPPTGRGVRTHFSDDLIWLPFVVNFYVKFTGDYSILNEEIPFIEASELAPDQEDAYIHPDPSEEKGTLFEHCSRALDRSLKVGAHGLPLIGCGDWNDGMNRVGHEGKGESVWVAWFLHLTLSDFLPLCKRFKDQKREKAYSQHLKDLKEAIELNAWDGHWYRRAYFDDGTPLGSIFNEECQIDSISQSWSVISGAGERDRAEKAMDAVDERLIQWDDKLVKLFTPPFDKTLSDPGYIKGYVPGVRENGGQYTHAAVWAMMAYAQLGDGERATQLYHLLNPINHSENFESMSKYKAEPYVMAADVYGLHPHIGRGGWTWYTGAASWMYRSALESILGFEISVNKFRVDPKVPRDWDCFSIVYYFGMSRYEITLKRGDSSLRHKSGEWIEMNNDGKQHFVEISF